MTTISVRVLAQQSEQVDGWLSSWREERDAQGKNTRVTKNCLQYVGAFRLFARRRFGIDLDTEDNAQLQEALVEFARSGQGTYKVRMADSTTQAKLAAIRVFYRWLMYHGEVPPHWLDFEGVIASKSTAHPPQVRASVNDYVVALMSTSRTELAGMRDFCLVALSAYAGFNFNGVAHLTVGDLSLENGEVSIPVYSSGSDRERGRREVKLPEKFAEAFSAYIDWAYPDGAEPGYPAFPRMNRSDWQYEPVAISEMMVYFILTRIFGRQNIRATVPSKDFTAAFERFLEDVDTLMQVDALG